MDEQTEIGAASGPVQEPDGVVVPAQPAPSTELESLGDAQADDVLHQLVSEELGESIAELMRQMRRAHETWRRQTHPNEGLRERKRRITRQLISDAATVLFAMHGFDNVKVADVADRVGVSEKTVYNYFPTKESLVLDGADETIERVAAALRDPQPDESLTQAVVRALKEDVGRFQDVPDEMISFIPTYGEMIDSTPALRAAWLEVHDRLAVVARDALAKRAEVDPDDPEPMIAGHALAGLSDVVFESRIRHVNAGLRGEDLRTAVITDLERAARLLETGLWSFNMLARGAKAKTQALEAARAAEEARTQVVKALRQARTAFNDARDRSRATAREAREAAREAGKRAREADREARAAARERPRH